MAIGKGITSRSHHVGKIDIGEELARELALKSIRIDNMLKDGVEEAEISVSLKVLEIAISFCSQLVHHLLLLHTRGGGGGGEGGGENTKEEIRKKIAGFDRPVLMEFVTAMDQLLIKELLDMACYEALRRIKGRKTDYNVRNTFNIRYMYLYSEEEFDMLKRENELVGIGVSAELMKPGEVDALEDEDSLSKKISNLYSIQRERFRDLDGFLVDFEQQVIRLDDYIQRSFVHFFINHKPKEIIKHFIRRLELSDARHEYYQKLRNKLCEISATTDEKALMSIKLMKDNANDVKVKVDQIISDMQISDFFKDCQEYEGTEHYLSVLKEEHYAMIDEILLYVDLSLQPYQRVILRMMERSQIEMLETDTELQTKQDEHISIKEEPELPSSKHSEDSWLDSNRSRLEEFKDLSSQAHYVCRQHNFVRDLWEWILSTVGEKMGELREATFLNRDEFSLKLLNEIHPKISGHESEFIKARETLTNCEVHEHSSVTESPLAYKDGQEYLSFKKFTMNLIDLAEQGRHKVDTDLRKLISQYGEDNISNVVLDLFTMRQCSYRGFNRLNVDEVWGVLYEEDGAFESRKIKGLPLRGEHNLEEESLDSLEGDVCMEELPLKRTKEACNNDSKRQKGT